MACLLVVDTGVSEVRTLEDTAAIAAESTATGVGLAEILAAFKTPAAGEIDLRNTTSMTKEPAVRRVDESPS